MVILCDFDDTTAEQNIATLLLERFQPNATANGAPHWHQVRDRFLRNEIGLVQYQELTFSRLATPHDEQSAYVRSTARLRPGFRELATYCRENDMALAIVSHGLDFYIRALLEEEELDHIPFFAVKAAERDGDTTFSYTFAQEGCGWWPGNCKCSIVQGFQEQGHQVVYAGDGASDTCPALRADYVFARDTLLRFCKNNALPHQELTDFHVVLDYVKALKTEATA